MRITDIGYWRCVRLVPEGGYSRFLPCPFFQLYNGVQARRGANDATADEQKNGGEREWGPAHRGESHPAAVPGPRRYGDGCKHSDPVSHQRDCGCCRAASGIGDLLQGYLGQEHQMSRKNNGARHVVSEDRRAR